MHSIFKPIVNFKRLHPLAKVPEYKTEFAIGADLYSVNNGSINPKEIKRISTGLSVEYNPYVVDSNGLTIKLIELQIRSRSGLASKGIIVMNQPGTIDPDYRGEIIVLLGNMSNDVFYYNDNTRIAQLIMSDVYIMNFKEVDELTETERGENGFGSTDIIVCEGKS